jgi:cobalt/nickel transport system permease protein
MHIPDGFLDAKTIAAASALSLGSVGYALKRATRALPPRRVPLMGLAAAFVFAAQMINFPVFGGTSGHLVGSVLVAVLLGPSAAVVVMTAVLIVQCLLFGDGGLLSLGANVFNMAVLATMSGYGIFRIVRWGARGPAGLILAAAFAGWCSTVLASVSCAGQLALSHTAAWNVTFPAMFHIHMFIGVGEGLITGLVLSAILKVRPELLEETPEAVPSSPQGPFLVYGLILVAGLVVFIAPFASPWPDGLDRVAQTLGFAQRARETGILPTPMADYKIPGAGSVGWSTACAGMIGTVVAFALSWVLARALTRKLPSKNEHPVS